jgi:hypothetical protein
MFAIGQNFPIFNDLDGTPLQNGAIYIGSPNLNPEATPVVVYWDFAGTQPASQPLQTVNGIIARDGTPANVFINQDYSITVRNKKNAIIYSLPSSNAAALNPVSNYSTQVAAQAASVDASVLFITVGGYAAVNDGGDARYASVANTGGLTSYQFQSNGTTRRWQLIPQNGNIKAEQLGVVGNASDTGILQIADAAAAALGVELLIDKVHALGSTLSFTNQVRFVKGGKLVPATNVQINFSAAGFEAPVNYAIFDFSASGSGFTANKVTARELYPQMFGAVPNSPASSAVNTGRLNQWLNAVAVSGIPGNFSPNKFNSAGQVVLDYQNSQYYGLNLKGAGGDNSGIVFDANVASPNFKITSSGTLANGQRAEFYGTLEGWSVRGTPPNGSSPGKTLQFGETTINQSGVGVGGPTVFFNGLNTRDVVSSNSTAGGWGTLFTGFASCSTELTSNCLGSAYDGSAGCAFIFCSYSKWMLRPGSANYGLYFPAYSPDDPSHYQNYCYANQFQAGDNEGVKTAIYNRSTAFTDNTFTGIFSANDQAIDSTVGRGNVVTAGSLLLSVAVSTFANPSAALGTWGGFGFTLKFPNDNYWGQLLAFGPNTAPTLVTGTWIPNIYGQDYIVYILSNQVMTVFKRGYLDRSSAGSQVAVAGSAGAYLTCQVLVKAGESFMVTSTGTLSYYAEPAE